MSIQEQPAINQVSEPNELSAWLNDWPTIQNSEHANEIVEPSFSSEDGEEYINTQLDTTAQAIGALLTIKNEVANFAVTTREQLETNQRMAKEFWHLVENLVEVAHNLDRLVEKERPLLTAADASEPFLNEQIKEHSADYALIEQYSQDLGLLRQQLAIIEDNIDINNQLIASSELTPNSKRDPKKHLEDFHVLAAVNRSSILLSEKTAKEAEIEKLKEQIAQTAQRITEQATAQALRSKDAQENRNKIIEQAEKAVNNAVYKVGQTISQNSAVGKAMMLAALELQEQVTERQIER